MEHKGFYKASTVLMVPPSHFQYNPETAISNAFQNKLAGSDTTKQALHEFEVMVKGLENKNIRVITMPQEKPLPDAVFPNNWFSTHLNENNSISVYIYPMFTPNRQEEVDIVNLTETLKRHNIEFHQLKDLRHEAHGALESTGSVILDRKNKKLYAAVSPRTHPKMIEKLAKELNYESIPFNSSDAEEQAIYHTNVMMSVAEDYAIVCLESIRQLAEKRMVLEQLENSGKAIIPISFNQTANMCGNALELSNTKGESVLVMSERAYQNYDKEQIRLIEQYSEILTAKLDTIENIGGGSARCMMAEIYH